MGAAAEVPVLSAGAEAVVVPVPKLVAVPMLLGDAVLEVVGDSRPEAEGVDVAVALVSHLAKEGGNITPAELQSSSPAFNAAV